MTNFNEMWDLLEKYSFEIDYNLLQHLKCVICEKLLVDAHEGLCGCNYCRNCIKSYLKEGPKQCPGDSPDCQLTHLEFNVNIIRSNSTNRKILKLVVICPSNNCKFTGELLTIKDHLRICDKRSIYCPYKEIGCNQSPLPMHNISEHLTIEQFQHAQLLINFILNLKNEDAFSNSLKFSESFNFMSLNKVFTSKNYQVNIETIPQVLQDLHEENVNLRNEMAKNKNNLEQEIDKLKQLINSKFDRKPVQELSNEISCKKEINYFNNEGQIQENVNNENLNKTLDNLTICDTLHPNLNNNDTTKHDLPIEQPLNSLEIRPNQTATFTWLISDLSKIIKKNLIVDSEHFFSKNGDLKIWLDLYTGNRKQMRIRIYISTTSVNSLLKWPLFCQVEITIKNIKDQKAFQRTCKNCCFDKPKFNSSYETFEFRNLDLENANVLQNNKILIECSLDIGN